MTEMNQYIGTKRVLARPMNRQSYNDYRGWTLPENENGADEGMLVEYLDGGQANDPRHKGYISWSPLDVFNRAYRQTIGMTFGEAIEALKAGLRVARAGWNGKGMWLFLIQGSNDIAKLHGYGFGEMVGEPVFRDAIFMKTVDNQLVPWTASQTDVLAEDWAIADSAAQAQPVVLNYETEVDKMLAQVDAMHTPASFTDASNALMRGLVVLGTYSASKEHAIILAEALATSIRQAIPEAFEIAHG
jgi:hypothetical protein